MILRRVASGRTFSCLRKLHSSQVRSDAAYEGSGKTTVKILNENQDYLLVDAYSKYGFLLSNNVRIMGPCVVLPDAILSWKIPNPPEMTERAFSLFQVLHPRPDVVFFGYGSGEGEMSRASKEQIAYRNGLKNMVARVMMTMRKQGVNVEAYPTEDAISAYNYMVSEERLVAAALIPPEVVVVDRSSDSQMQALMHHKEFGKFTDIDIGGYDKGDQELISGTKEPVYKGYLEQPKSEEKDKK